MKKALSIVLSMLMIFSMVGVMAFAEDATKATYVFKNGEEVVATVVVDPNEVNTLAPYLPANPVKEDTEDIRYTFKGWLGEDGELYYQSTVPAPKAEDAGKTITYVAQFAEEDISGRQSLWNFIESLFERLNLLFEYFAKVFQW